MFDSKNGKIYFAFIIKVTSNIFNTRTIVINGHEGEDKAIMKCLGYEDWYDQTLDNFT